MNEEIEIKVALKNPAQVEETLNKIAKFINSKEQVDQYFTPKNHDFFKQKPVTEFLRIRTDKDNSSLDYHFCHFDNNNDLLKSDEYETEINNPEVFASTLKNLGFIKKVTVTKLRKTFIYKDFEIVLDFIKELGPFLEVEAKKSFGTAEQTRAECLKILKEINAEWDKPINKGYPELVLNHPIH